MDDQMKLLLEVRDRTASQQATLEHLVSMLDEHVKNDRATFKDLYGKCAELEKFRSRAKGGAMTVGLLGAVVALLHRIGVGG